MNFEHLFAPHEGKTVRVGLAGAGEFGRSFLFRSGRVKQLQVVAVADRDIGRAKALVGNLPIKVVDDATLLPGMDLDMIVEATGEPEVAARTAELALEHRKHFAMVTKEADCVVGPILHARAREAGIVFTPVDGDQPSLLVSLVTRTRLLGLDIVCAGKAGEYDLVAGMEKNPSLHCATVPDYCELTIVANATGLRPDVPSLHAPVARTLDLPNLFRPRGAGGLLQHTGVVDMFVCHRRPDELSFAGGVFVIVRCDDAASWQVLKEKGIPLSDDGGYALVHNPVHLLGIEAPVSVLSAALLGMPAARLEPRFDMHARATASLSRNAVLKIGERHTIPGVEALIAPMQPSPVPYYMLSGARLKRDVSPGTLITRDMVEPPAESALWRLRAEQDAKFFP